MRPQTHVLFFIILLYICGGLSLDFKVVDLTHDHSNTTIYWPGNPEYNFTILARGNTTGGFWYESNYIGTAEHGGTHLDSPAHFYKDRLRTHNIPIENLVGPGVIINVKNKAAANADYQVSIDDLKQWENIYKQIPENAIVIMNSGWNDRYPNASLVFNTDSPTDSNTFHFPAWHETTIEWLISKRSVNVVGVDTPSTDFGQSKTFPVHILLGQANIPGAENVANLDAIPEAGSIIFVAVTKIYDGSGGPARIFATVPINDTSSGCSHELSFVLLMCAFCIFIQIF
ncbi:isatin hydrolase-like [Mytilus californianus]|uniref:isatin hydrolase-like n=1 Tax=Mytilus californianus TaxID=6549 RepID=UPI0022486B97|nr:isatin hydrolase-like [Mytilus californianus]